MRFKGTKGAALVEYMPLMAGIVVVVGLAISWLWPTIEPVFYTDIPVEVGDVGDPVDPPDPTTPPVCPVTSRAITGPGTAGQGWNTRGGEEMSSYTYGSLVAFPDFGPRANRFCPREGWTWNPANLEYELDHPAEEHPFLALFPRLATSIIRPGSDPFPQRPAIVDPAYPDGYNFWARYNAPYALIYHAWDWTEFIPGGVIRPPHPSCFGSGGGEGAWVPSMSVGGTVTGTPPGFGGVGWPVEGPAVGTPVVEPRACDTAPDESFFAYGVNVIDFAFGTDGGDAITVAERPGAMGFLGDDTLGADAPYLGRTFIGGPGTDSMSGNAGGDLYIYSVGDGNDTITDNAAALGGPRGTDTVRFVEMDMAQLTFSVSGAGGQDVRIATLGGGSVTLVGTYSGLTTNAIELVQTFDGFLDTKGIRDAAAEGMKPTGLVLGSTGSETFTVRSGDPSFSIQERGLSNVAQFDELVFANHTFAQVVWSGSGNNATLTTPDGTAVTLVNQRTLNRLEHVDSIRFSDGTVLDWSQIRTQLGFAAPLTGTRTGTTGDDVYAFRRGDGAVSFTDPGGFDTVFFPDLASGDVVFGRSGSSQRNLTITAGSDVLTLIDGSFWGGGTVNYFERFVFSDGVEIPSWDASMDRYLADATAMGQTVFSTPRNETLTWSPDIGNMVLERVNSSTGNGVDVVDIVGVRPDQVEFSRSLPNAPGGANLFITAPNGSVLTLSRHLVSTNVGLQFPTIRFPDVGTTYTYAQGLQRYADDAMITGVVHDPAGPPQIYTYSGGTVDFTAEVGGAYTDMSADTLIHSRPLAGATITRTAATGAFTIDFGNGDVLRLGVLGWNRAVHRIPTHRFTDGDRTTQQLLQVYAQQAVNRGNMVDTYGNDAVAYTSGALSILRGDNNEIAGGTDTLTFTGRTLASATISRNASRHLVIDFGGGDRVFIEHQFGSGSAAWTLWESFVFADQTLTGAAMRALAP
jgi:hypothetical protein